MAYKDSRRYKYDQTYMKMAVAMSLLSYANRNKVGCIIVSKDDQIISQGFNGTPSGYDNCCEDPHCDCKYHYGCSYTAKPIKEQMSVKFCINPNNSGYPCEHLTLTTKPEVLHAESNAISKCAKWHTSTEGATLYVTLSPCFECAKLIIQSGIKRVCYLEQYRDISGIEFLEKNNIQVEQIEI